MLEELQEKVNQLEQRVNHLENMNGIMKRDHSFDMQRVFTAIDDLYSKLNNNN